ncbi:uncharacterized protein KY384_003473 [Bacidia gigantensis]|uniref:uncharacterized protein n=1 Tax=Bacidia gigantensis TaxID=2732470 RepID=UPI001D05508A|nr:uncharacterized protein KY384_003473 [Bacidia gigantensis]KAG8531837.1 hypothetical protein KY384_003473 [Bacidia gigantensis]
MDWATKQGAFILRGMETDGYDIKAIESFIQFAYGGFYDVPQPIMEEQTGSKRSLNSAALSSVSSAGIPTPSSPLFASTHSMNTSHAFMSPPGHSPAKPYNPIPQPGNLTPASSSAASVFASATDNTSNLGASMRTPYNARPDVRANMHSGENYTPVFLHHAQVYIFAASKGIGILADHALNELTVTLSKFTLYKERIGDIVALVRWVYSYLDDDRGAWANEEPLRKLIRRVIKRELVMLIKDEEFQDLMVEDSGEGGWLLKDVMDLVGGRLEA